MISPDDDDSIEQVISALVAIFGYSGLLILGVIACIVVAALAS